MLAQLLLPILFSPNQIQRSNQIPLVVIAQSERLPDQLPEKPGHREVERLLTANSISFYKYELDGFAIYVSKKIAAINELETTAWWLKSVTESRAKKFSLESREGKVLLDAFGQSMPVSGLKADPGQEFMAIAPAFHIKRISGTEFKPFTLALDNTPPELSTAYIPLDEQNNSSSLPSHLTPFPASRGMTNYSIIDFGAVKEMGKQTDSILAVSGAFRMLGRKFDEVQKEVDLARETLLAQMLDDALQTPGTNLSGERSFKELPRPIRDQLLRYAAEEPGRLGLKGNQEILDLLLGNPNVHIEFRVAFLIKSSSNEDRTGGSIATVFLGGV